MTSTNFTRELTKQEIDEFREAFDMFDMDGGGTIESHELRHVMNKLGEQPSDEELDDMIRAVDLNGDGEIDFEEFISLMRLRMDERQRDPEEDLRDAFNMFDADRSGYIDREEVRMLMKKLAQTLTEDEIDAIMEEVDTDGDGEISFDEFRAMMFA